MINHSDILLNKDETPVITNGDFVIAPAGEQQIRQIIKSNPGDYKYAPLVGVGIIAALNGPQLQRMESKIREQLSRAGFSVNSVTVIDKEISIDAD